MLFVVVSQVGPMNGLFDGDPDPHGKGQVFGRNGALLIGSIGHAVRCHLGWRMEWAQGIVFQMGMHIGATWQIWLNNCTWRL